ncbi:MAG: carbohydrate kinase family protein [Planctomycetota bacterium]|jgi:sugar/nucleoside kinase (ribokinase family)
MARRRVIVSIGEAILAEHPDREEPAGLALLVPKYAVLLGHEGIAISRVGQDRAADELIRQLRAVGVDVTHIQNDPDLATGRLLVRSLGGKHGLDSLAAFDSLQWDFDLADVAQRADAVVFGALARRSGQARSTSDRFLAECTLALRVFDLTNRPGQEYDRRSALSGLGFAEALIIDKHAVNDLLPSAGDKPPRKAATELIRASNLTFVLAAEPGEPLVIHTAESSWQGHDPHRREAHEACVVGLLHGVLAGWDLRASLELAERMGRHALQHPGEPPPEEVLQRT